MNNEKGIALIAALMVLMVLTLLGISAILTSTTDMQIANNEKNAIQGQYAAEAGIEEALVKLNYATGEPGAISEPSPAPVWGSTPALGSNYSDFDDWSPPVAGNIMDGAKIFFSYSATVSYKRVGSGTYLGKVAFYNQASGYDPPAPATGGWPVYVITSVASTGNYQTQANILEVTKNNFNFDVRGGFTAGGDVVLKGNPTMDGQHHDIDGNAVTTGSNCKSAGLSAGMPGVYSTGDVDPQGSVDFNNSSGQDMVENAATAVPTTPWGAMGIKLDAADTTTVPFPGYENGPYFVEIFPSWPSLKTFGSSGLTGNQYYTSSSNNDNITGNGLLILHNPNFVPGVCADGIFDGNPTECAAANAPATLDANTGTFRGIIIADQISLRGNVTIIGAVISLSTLSTEATGAGTPTISYSCQAIERFAAGQINKKLNWRKE